MDDILRCKNCDFYCTSEKIFFLHMKECKEIPKEKLEDINNNINSINQINNEPDLVYEEIHDYAFIDLKQYASRKGINTYRMKKADIIKELLALHELEG